MTYAWTLRSLALAGGVLSLAVIALAIGLQQHYGLEPCPLCIFQRVAFFSGGMLLLAAALSGRMALRPLAALAALAYLAGAGLAGRHLWLEHLPPDQVPACGPDLAYLLEAFPLQDVVRTVLAGSGECAKVSWTFLDLSLPGWALLTFLLLLFTSLFLLLKRPHEAA